jgi:glycosyltransferase involved in cell wall biosynthesis
MSIYNVGKEFRDSILSIKKQTFKDWELVIVDDGSSNDPVKFIKDLLEPRIKILQDGKNMGIAARLNQIIDIAKGSFFARMDHDDISFPERFEKQINMLRQQPELDLISTRAIVIDENNKALKLFPFKSSHSEICAKPWLGFYFPHPSWMGKTEWFKKHRYKTPAPYLCEDQELLLRTYKNSRFQTLNEFLLGYRTKKQTDWNKLRKTRKSVLKMQLDHFKQTRQFSYALLAFMVFLTRNIFDILEQNSHKSIENKQLLVDENINQKWNQALEKIGLKF